MGLLFEMNGLLKMRRSDYSVINLFLRCPCCLCSTLTRVLCLVFEAPYVVFEPP